MNPLSRYRGCLLGLAVGDALGTTLEFTSPGAFTPIDDLIGGGPFQLKPGQWTDDTSMALCLATSLIERHGFDPVDQLERYVRWWREGYLSSTGTCFDIGSTVRSALTRFLQTREPYPGSTDPRTAGNGSIMRLAPVVLYFARQPAQAVHFAAESSRTTHGAAEAVDACRYFATLILAALNGESKAALLSEQVDRWQAAPLAPKIAALAGGSFKRKEPPAIRGTGYVVDSLEAALWAFHHSSDFREGALLAVNLGEDADTTGAVYGQLAGAFYGEENIPAAWRDTIAQRQLMVELAEKLYAAAETSEV
ncbi:ADP-ribosylarginine hydrolase Tri1 [Thermoflexales bacterium]|nr:ADP-ribosylarginine hydrolase Tri1 [Thermoflexales bacterium]